MTKNTTHNRNEPSPDTSRSIHLSASAGSGKTKALVDRYLELIGSGRIEIDQAVAITFTDKAAAEMKQRVMQSLADAARRSAAGGDAEAMFKKIIRGRQELRISTIHSFCMNLLKRYPLEAGLPPDFGILDVRDRAAKIERSIDAVLEQSLREHELLDPLSAYTAYEITSKLGFLFSRRSQLKRLEIDAGGPDALVDAFRAGMGLDRAEREVRGIIGGGEWRRALLRMEELLRPQGAWCDTCKGDVHRALAQEGDVDRAFEIAERLKDVYFTKAGDPRSRPFIAKKEFSGPRDEYETAFSGVQRLLAAFTSGVLALRSQRETLSILRLYLRAEEQYRNAKLRDGLLDFDDLEIYAYGLLQRPESLDILYWLDRKIIHYLIDEFQDTSDIQWAVLDKLTEEIFAGIGADKPMPPTLFVVGDEKQSIYRFREANYRIIRSVRDRMERLLPEDARRISTLSANYRSVPEIITTVNEVFSALWGEDYVPSDPDRKRHRGSVRLLELSDDHPDAGHPGLAPEASVLASEIRRVVGSGTTVYERTGDGWTERRADHGDCAVLIQSRTRLKDYETALRAFGIPYRVIGGVGFYEEEEIQAVISALFFLWNREDRLSLAAALTSPLFGLTDADIYGLRAGGGDMLDALRAAHPAAWETLRRWSADAGLVPLAGLIHRIVGDTAAYVRFGKLKGVQAIFNIDKLLDTARDFDRRGYTTLQDFVEWVKGVRRSEEQEATADVNLPEFQGSVVITTVHKAKGLEFPVVFLPGLDQSPRSLRTGPEVLISADDGGLRMSVKDEGPVYGELWKNELEQLRREHQRLLYVAMTRARDHLVLTGTRGGTAPRDTWLAYLRQAAPSLLAHPVEAAPGLTRYDYPAQPASPAPRARGSAEPAAPSDAAVLDVRTVAVNLAGLPVSETLEWKKATDLIGPVEEEMVPAPAVAGISPLLRGSILHRCLEELTKGGAYDIEGILKEFPEATAAGKESAMRFIADARATLAGIVNKPEFSWIFERREGSYSELPFLSRRGTTLVSGVIDRVVVRERTGFVIDYKAIAVDDDRAREFWTRHYRPQLAVYCEAVKDLFRLDAVEGSLLFLDSARLEPILTM